MTQFQAEVRIFVLKVLFFLIAVGVACLVWGLYTGELFFLKAAILTIGFPSLAMLCLPKHDDS